MDRLFETRKRELVQECVVEDGLFARSLMRLDEFMKPFIAQLPRLKQRHYATTVVRGLCSDLERKNAESIAYHFGMDRKQIQHFIGISEWDDQHFRKELARQIVTQLGEQDGVLYLPEEWTKNKTRMKKAGIPNHKQKYHTRHQMCLELLNEHGQSLPHQWITGETNLADRSNFAGNYSVSANNTCWLFPATRSSLTWKLNNRMNRKRIAKSHSVPCVWINGLQHNRTLPGSELMFEMERRDLLLLNC